MSTVFSYHPDDSFAHGLDPRTKIFVQLAFAAAAYAHTTPRGLAGLSVVAIGCLWASGGSFRRVGRAYRALLPVLAIAPLVAGATLGEPWFVLADARTTGLASLRVGLILLVAAGYVRSTPPRLSRAAVQQSLPGRPGQFLGVGIGLVFRFLPLLRRDLLAIRDASQARLGGERSLRERIQTVATGGLSRAMHRSDRLAVALQARCLSWNPTSPPLQMGRADGLGVAVGGLLIAVAAVGVYVP